MRKKTTKEEREEIVRYCLEHGKDYKGVSTKKAKPLMPQRFQPSPKWL